MPKKGQGWRYNEANLPALQAAADADPRIQAAHKAYREYVTQYGRGGQAKREGDRLQRALEDAINANPVLRAAKVAEGTVRAGYTFNPMAKSKPVQDPTTGKWSADDLPLQIVREGSDVGHVIRDMVLPAAGAGAIFAAPAIIGSQAAGGGSGAASAAPTATAPVTAQTITGAGYAGGGGGIKSALLGALKNRDAVSAIGEAVSSGVDAAAQNRGTQVDTEFEKLREQRAQEEAFFRFLQGREQMRDDRADSAWKRAQQADYISGWTPRAGVSPYTRPLQAPGELARTASSDPTLRQLLLSRMNYSADPFGGEMPRRTPDFSGVSKNQKPGAMENILGPVGTGLSIWGGLARAMR